MTRKSMLMALVALMTALLSSSCSTEHSLDGSGPEGSTIPVTFTMTTPAGEVIPYGATRATHDEAEWTIHRLGLYVYSVDGLDKGTYLRSYSTDAVDESQRINIVANGAGTYTFTLKLPVSDLNMRQRFVFVANDAITPEPGASESEDELVNKLATVTLSENDTADKLAAEDTGIAMSGVAQNTDDDSDVITITPGVKCEVHLKRIVARVDVQNNTPNMVIKEITLLQAPTKGRLFGQSPITSAEESYVTMKMNSKTALGTSYAEQTDLKKVFYVYERPNTDGAEAKVRVSYMINNTPGSVEVPFKTTGAEPAYVDITRNTLYTIVLGDGTPIVTNEVKFTLKVEEWNVVDMEEPVDPDLDAQLKLNAALKVNMFTQFNVLSLNKDTKKVTFYDTLEASQEKCPETSYFSYNWLSGKDDGTGASSANGANTDTDLRNAIFTDDAGNQYRLPTAGEMALLLPMFTEEEDLLEINGNKIGTYYPFWNDNNSTNTDGLVMVEEPFTEKIYLKNNENFTVDTSHDESDGEYTISGESQLKLGPLTHTVHYHYTEDLDDPQKDNYNIHRVYGLRFKGTSQYAAYRWENMYPECYLSIKIKALPSDSDITIDEVSRESYWKDGYIEMKFPACGFYNLSSQELSHCGVHGYFWTSTIDTEDTRARCLGFAYTAAHVFRYNTQTRYQLRLVKVTPAGGGASGMVQDPKINGWGNQGVVDYEVQANR